MASSLAQDAQALWSSSAISPVAQDMSHWIGRGRWRNHQAWLENGHFNHRLFERTRAHVGIEAAGPMETMLEWGQGGGSNLVAFARTFSTLYGVDISKPNLVEASHQMDAQASGANFHPVYIDAATPRQAMDTVEGPIDFFLSVAVYQHFPGRDYGFEVNKIAAELVRPGGLALIQIRYNDLSERFPGHDDNYLQNFVEFTSYRLEEFRRHLKQVGFEVVDMDLLSPTYYAYFMLRRL